MSDEKPRKHPTLAEIMEKAVIWPLIEREMEILKRHELIPQDTTIPAEKEETDDR
jgi:hypothetical protein